MNVSHVALQELRRNLTLLKILVRQKRHYNFVGEGLEEEKCFRPTAYEESISESCEFVTNTESCVQPVIYFNYLKFMVCVLHIDSTRRGFILAGLVSFVIVLTFALFVYIISKYFLMPNCFSLLEYLKMKNYDFGAVVLPALFILPEVINSGMGCYHFSETSGIRHTETAGRVLSWLIFGLALMGLRASIVINGTIFIREMLFLIIGISLALFTLLREMFNVNNLPEQQLQPIIYYTAYVSVGIYFIYVVNMLIFSKRSEDKSSDEDSESSIHSSTESIQSDEYPVRVSNPINYDIDPWDILISCINPANIDIKNKFLKVLFEFEKTSNNIKELFECFVFQCPFYVLLAFFIPVVHPDRPLQGWCKVLFCTSFIAYPMYFSNNEFSTYTWTGIILVDMVIFLMVVFLTHAQRRPRNHELVAVCGLIIGFITLNTIDEEASVLMWQILHYMAGWDDGTIVLLAFPLTYLFVEGIFLVTLLNSGRFDLIFGFIMGSVMVMVYSMLPLVTFSICLKLNQYFVITGPTLTAFIFMYIIIIFAMISTAMSGFEIRKSHGVFFLSLSFVFDMFIILNEATIVHSFGTVHSLKVFSEAHHVNWA